MRMDSFREWHKDGNLSQERLLKVQLQNGFGVNLSQMEPPYRAADSRQPLRRAVLLQMLGLNLGSLTNSDVSCEKKLKSK